MTLTPGRVNQGLPGAQANAWYVRPRTPATYGAGYRLAAATAGNTNLTFTPVANTDKQLATIHHLVGSTKTVRLRRVSVMISVWNAAVYQFEIRRLSATTAPATGNPAITPAAYDSSDGAAEAVCLALPTTQGSETAADRPLSIPTTWNAGVAVASTNPLGAGGAEIMLFDGTAMTERKLPVLRAGVAEGFAIIGRATAVSNLTFTAYIEFSEE